MELIHIYANATFSSSRIKSNQLISLENLASKTKLTKLLKSTRRACAHRTIMPAHPVRRARIIARHRVWAWRESGGASRDRTGDLLVANQTLSQLSYGPSSIGENRRDDFRETLHGCRSPRERPWGRCA